MTSVDVSRLVKGPHGPHHRFPPRAHRGAPVHTSLASRLSSAAVPHVTGRHKPKMGSTRRCSLRRETSFAYLCRPKHFAPSGHSSFLPRQMKTARVALAAPSPELSRSRP